MSVLLLRSGKLSINNRFSNVREEPKAVIDSMDIALSDVNFAMYVPHLSFLVCERLQLNFLPEKNIFRAFRVLCS